jgi:HTH-type transcriptional regulator/antitoxin HipB
MKSKTTEKTENMDDKNITTFEEHLEKRYGALETDQRMAFEAKAKAFAIGELIKEERRLSNKTQEQLALKTGT